MRRFLLWRVLPATAGWLLLFLVALFLLQWATQAADRIAVEREIRLFESAVAGLRARVAHDQESVTVWDDAVVRLSGDDAESRTWVDTNLLVWMHDYFGHDAVYLLDPDDRPIRAFREGETLPPEAYEHVRPVVGPLVATLRQRLADGDETGTGPSVLSIGEADFGAVEGHPAIVSVKPVVPAMETEPPPPEPLPGRNILHVSILYLDGAFLKRLESEQGFRELRFSVDPDVRRPDDEAYPLRDTQGRGVGYFIWSPFRPGDTILHQITLALGGVFGLAGIGVASGLVILYRHTRGEIAARREAHHLAFYDPLTGLPNRVMLHHHLSDVLAALPEGGPVGVLHVDLERFKLVNESLGRDAGNAILVSCAERLSRLLRPGELMARIGGDEFVLVTAGRGEAGVRALAEAILAGARVPFRVDHDPVLVGLFVGYCLARTGDVPAEECLRRADVARFHARSVGRARCAAFGDDMDVLLRVRRETERDLQAALLSESDGLAVFFQPVFSLADGRVVGAEALVRWYHPVRGLVMPDVFIPVAEEADLIGALGMRVLREACTAAARWPGQQVAVNASPRELGDPDYPGRVAAALAAAGLEPGRLQIEVTETAMIEASEQTVQTFAALRRLGVSVVLDDFGTGFSSLSRLRHLDVDRIKIDRSFIAHIRENGTDRAIVQAIVDMAHAAGLQTTVEGVETADQGALLREMGCDHVQGYFYARPMPLAEVDRLMGTVPSRPPDVAPLDAPV